MARRSTIMYDQVPPGKTKAKMHTNPVATNITNFLLILFLFQFAHSYTWGSQLLPCTLSANFNQFYIMSLTKPDVDDSFDIILPASYFTESSTGECSILVQIEPQDAMLLDFEGASGAIGRFEADANGRE